jgi:hypothetical protein
VIAFAAATVFAGCSGGSNNAGQQFHMPFEILT